MSRDDLHFRLRIPADLKASIEASAKANNRSMTAEIINRLQNPEGNLRDFIAAQALNGLLAADQECGFKADVASECAYRFADAMIAAREGGAK